MKVHLALVPNLLCVACFLVCYLHLDFEAEWLEDACRPLIGVHCHVECTIAHGLVLLQCKLGMHQLQLI